MLTDAFGDFTILAKEPDADLSMLLEELETELHEYSGKFWEYNRQVIPLLRKAARWHVAGKLSWSAVNAVSNRLIRCYVGLEGTEEMLADDLRAYIRVKPTIDLNTSVGASCRRRRTSHKANQANNTRTQTVPSRTSAPTLSATTSTGVVLRLVR